LITYFNHSINFAESRRERGRFLAKLKQFSLDKQPGA